MNVLVLDTSTLILLAKMDLLEPLTQKVRCVIPETVAQEATRKRELMDAKIIGRLIEEKRIQIAKGENYPVAGRLENDFLLGRAEAEAIALAKSKRAPLGVDDRLAMRACKVMGVSFITALGFLIRFYERGFITRKQIDSKFEKLKKYGWYQPELLKRAAEEIERGGKR